MTSQTTSKGRCCNRLEQLRNFQLHPIKERVRSEMKISDKIKFHPKIVPFALIFFRIVTFPSDINSGHNISLSGPCIIASGPALLLLDRHLFYRNLSVQKNKTNGRKGTKSLTSEWQVNDKLRVSEQLVHFSTCNMASKWQGNGK